MTEALIAVIAYIAFIAIVLRFLRANGEDVDADEAADSVRAALDADVRATNHVKAGTAYGRPVQ